jgi:Uma2 family endonuclease
MSLVTQRYSLDDYRQIEETTEGRREFRDGELVEITGGTLDHAQIIGNLYYLLRLGLMESRFRPINSELRLWLPIYRRGTYPDAMIIEGEPRLNDDRQDEILNPCLIAEVLSPTTEGYDRGDKFRMYRSIPEFCDYLLIDSTQILVDHYSKVGDNWLLGSHQQNHKMVRIDNLGIELPIDELYNSVRV